MCSDADRPKATASNTNLVFLSLYDVKDHKGPNEFQTSRRPSTSPVTDHCLVEPARIARRRSRGRAIQQSGRRTKRGTAEFGGACRARTGDPLLAKQVLSQLS